MRPINGLYVLRLDTSQQPPNSPQAQQQQQSLTKNDPLSKIDGGADGAAAAPADCTNNNAQQQQLNTPAAILDSCRLLCRLHFDGIRSGSISGTVKLVSAANAASGFTNNVRALLSNDACWSFDNEHGFAVDNEGVMHVDFSVTLDRLEGVLLQVAHSLCPPNPSYLALAASNPKAAAAVAKETTRIMIHLSGTMCVGQGVGRALVTSSSSMRNDANDTRKNKQAADAAAAEKMVAMASDLRFVMHEVVCDRCVACGDPIHLNRVGNFIAATMTGTTATAPATASQQQQPSNATPLDAHQTTQPAAATTAVQNPAGATHPECPECLQYCSWQCRGVHNNSAKKLLPHLKPYTTSRASRCTASYRGSEFTVFWRAVTATTFVILVEPRNPLGICYEVLVDTLIEARQGLKVNIISEGGVTTSSTASSGTATANVTATQANRKQPIVTASSANASNSPPPPPTEPHKLIHLTSSVYESVIRSAMANGCVALAAACLNQLHVWCDHAPFVERQFLNFYDLCVGGGWDGLRLVSTLGEYVMLVRPMFECATVLIESALKSTLAGDFWYRLENAKGVLISLYNINGSVSFTPAVQHLRSTIVPEQQRETLLLLAKVFLMMAARAPEEQAMRLLIRAEECYTDAIEEDRLRQNLRRMALTTLSMSTLCLLCKGAEDKAETLRGQAVALLQSVAASPTAHKAQQQHCISTVISTIGTSDELGLSALVSSSQAQQRQLEAQKKASA